MKHGIIPDTQRKPGLCNEYLRAAGRYFGVKKPDVLVHLGDHWDFPSLSSWETNAKKGADEADIAADIEAGNDGLLKFEEGLRETGGPDYQPLKIMLRGNHEYRVDRALAEEPWLKGLFDACPSIDRQLGWNVYPFLMPVVVNGIAYCLGADHKVLTDNLEYIPLGDLSVGDKVVGFDEFLPGGKRSRQYKTAEIEAIDLAEMEVMRVEDSIGKVWYATPDHLWLASHSGKQFKWLRTDGLRPGKTFLGRYLPEWTKDRSYEAGYLAGVFDGEGYISKPNAKQGGLQVGFAQRDNSVLERSKRYLAERGFAFNEYVGGGTNGDVHNIKLAGPSGIKAMAIAQIGASRLINKFGAEALGSVQKMDGIEMPYVVSVEPAGKREIAMVKTTTETMIVEGYAHHNCHYFVRNANGMVMQSKRGSPSAKAMVVREGMSCTAGHQQGLQIHLQPVGGGRIHRGLIAGSCLTEDHKVLTADLRYVPLGDVKPGDKLVSFDEYAEARKRRFRTGTVLRTKVEIDTVFAVELSSGHVFKVTGDHRWMSRMGSFYKWRTTDSLQPHSGKRKGTRIPRLMPEWEAAGDYDSGWLSGIYDGEGHLYHRRTTGGSACQLGVSQAPGAVSDKIMDISGRHGLSFSTSKTKGGLGGNKVVYQHTLKGGTPEIARALGVLRPVRLLEKWKPEMLASVNRASEDDTHVVSVKKIGQMPVVRIDIDHKTMIVEGFGHHNCYEHDEDYLTAQGNAHWQGILMKHEVHDGQYNLCEVSLDYLRKNYL